MPFIRAKDGVVTITDVGGTVRNITTFVDGVDDTLESDVLDTTTYGAAYKSSARGFLGYSGTIKGKWDANGSLTPEQWITGRLLGAGTVPSNLWYGPAGSAAGRPFTSAAVWLSNYGRSGAFDSIVTWSVDFELASGSVVAGTL